MESVKVELKYNPYIKNTEILFNGKKPRINSMVEKYSNDILQDWLSDLPNIFKDEMNGYNFKLLFSGTENDYVDVVEAFKRKNITCFSKDTIQEEKKNSDYVFFSFENKLESYDIKVKKIDALIEWLKSCYTVNYDYESLINDNAELLSGDFSLVVLGNIDLEEKKYIFKDVSIECIDSVVSLETTNIFHTPIVIIVNEDVMESLPGILFELKGKGVTEKQLFFLNEDSLTSINVERLINDMGVNNPNIVTTLTDKKIRDYLVIYPFTDYIRDTIILMERIAKDIHEPIKNENEEFKRKNSDYTLNLDLHEHKINESKKAISALKGNRCSINEEAIFAELKGLENILSNWKANKTVITNDEPNAQKSAIEYEKVIKQQTAKFMQYFKNYYNSQMQNINDFCTQKCQAVDAFTKDKIVVEKPEFLEWEADMNIIGSLLGLHIEKDVSYDSIHKDKIFKKKEHPDFVHVTQYYYKDWRDWASDNVIEELKKNVMFNIGRIKDYESLFITECIKQINGILDNLIERKTGILNKLDSSHQTMQRKMWWIQEFEEYIESIKKD